MPLWFWCFNIRLKPNETKRFQMLLIDDKKLHVDSFVKRLTIISLVFYISMVRVYDCTFLPLMFHFLFHIVSTFYDIISFLILQQQQQQIKQTPRCETMCCGD